MNILSKLFSHASHDLRVKTASVSASQGGHTPEGLSLKRGFTLQNIMIASVVLAILTGIVGVSMYPTISKTKISAESSSIDNVRVASSGLIEDLVGFPSSLSSARDTVLMSRISNMPSDLKYYAVLLDGDGVTTTTNDRYLAIKAVADSVSGQDYLTDVVATLDNRLDNTDEGSETPAAGKFIYDTTCSAPATEATSHTDCYYITAILAKRTMPTDMAADTLIDGTTDFDADISAGGVADYVTPMN